MGSSGHTRIDTLVTSSQLKFTPIVWRTMTTSAVKEFLLQRKTGDLIIPEDLKKMVDEGKDVVILDGSWYMPAHQRDQKAEFAARRIPGARFFDVDGVADTSVNLPHMLPSPGDFESYCDRNGIKNDSTIVIYDGMGIFSSPRVWWTFKAFGHKNVKVLSGGIDAWKSCGYDVDTSPAEADSSDASKAAPGNGYKAELLKPYVVNLDELKAIASRQSPQVIDARPAPRFAGDAPEPRPTKNCGHIPGSVNVPFLELLEEGPSQGVKTYKKTDSLKEVFDKAGVDIKSPFVASCGSGVTASIVAFGLNLVGNPHPVAVYDGSWAEYGNRDDVDIEK